MSYLKLLITASFFFFKKWEYYNLWLTQEVSGGRNHRCWGALLLLCHVKPYLPISLALSHSKQNKESNKQGIDLWTLLKLIKTNRQISKQKTNLNHAKYTGGCRWKPLTIPTLVSSKTQFIASLLSPGVSSPKHTKITLS